ncbi:MAG: hypothetical protein ACE5G5_11735 [Candidatus Methylomirabilales bacterium]
MAREKAHERCPHRWCLFCGLYEVGINVGDGLKGLVPDELRHHLSTAQRETLLALRSILDRWIAGVEEKPGTRRRPQKIKVE